MKTALPQLRAISDTSISPELRFTLQNNSPPIGIRLTTRCNVLMMRETIVRMFTTRQTRRRYRSPRRISDRAAFVGIRQHRHSIRQISAARRRHHHRRETRAMRARCIAIPESAPASRCMFCGTCRTESPTPRRCEHLAAQHGVRIGAINPNIVSGSVLQVRIAGQSRSGDSQSRARSYFGQH